MLTRYTALRDEIAARIDAAWSLPETAVIHFGKPRKPLAAPYVVVLCDTEIQPTSIYGRATSWKWTIYGEFPLPPVGTELLGLQIDLLQRLADQFVPTSTDPSDVQSQELFAGVARDVEVAALTPGEDDDTDRTISVTAAITMTTDCTRTN